jgi:hypothetical protein
MLRQLVAVLQRTKRCEPKKSDTDKYGRYAYLFHEEVPPHVKYADPCKKMLKLNFLAYLETQYSYYATKTLKN